MGSYLISDHDIPVHLELYLDDIFKSRAFLASATDYLPPLWDENVGSTPLSSSLPTGTDWDPDKKHLISEARSSVNKKIVSQSELRSFPSSIIQESIDEEKVNYTKADAYEEGNRGRNIISSHHIFEIKTQCQNDILRLILVFFLMEIKVQILNSCEMMPLPLSYPL